MKQVLDFLIALTALIILSPILIVVSILIYFKLGRPIFFNQDRPGLDGKIFKIYKFSSMLNVGDQSLPDSERLTVFGQKLRASSLDELPALWNVLKGDISLVGPRPLLVCYLPLYSFEQARRHEVKPGITGWAQINGRNAISWEQKFKYDVWYVDNHSLWLDFKILLRTIKKVFVREGITQAGEVTMAAFKGSNGERRRD